MSWEQTWNKQVLLRVTILTKLCSLISINLSRNTFYVKIAITQNLKDSLMVKTSNPFVMPVDTLEHMTPNIRLEKKS
jgi:hypothetical protein